MAPRVTLTSDVVGGKVADTTTCGITVDKEDDEEDTWLAEREESVVSIVGVTVEVARLVVVFVV